MGINPKPNGGFEVSLWSEQFPGGRFRRKYKTEEITNAVHSKLITALALGNVADVLAELNRKGEAVTTVADLLDRYLEGYAVFANRDKASKKSRVKILKAGSLGKLPAAAVTAADVTAHCSRRKKANEKLSNATLNREVTILKHAFRWAHEQGLIRANSLASLRKFIEARKAPRPSEEVEAAIAKTFEKLDAELLPLFVFIYETGCRRDEALSLKHSQIRLDDAIVLLPQTKSGKPRYLGLTETAIGAIRAMPRASTFVFYNPDTLNRWYDCRKPWKKAREAAGCKWLTVKDLRTAFAMRLADCPGIEKHVIQTLLGHASLGTTERFYAFHSAEKAVKRGLKLVENTRKGAVA